MYYVGKWHDNVFERSRQRMMINIWIKKRPDSLVGVAFDS